MGREASRAWCLGTAGHNCLWWGCGSDNHLGHHSRDHHRRTTTELPATVTTTRDLRAKPRLNSAGEVQAGTQFDVTWSGPDNEGDFVTIVAAGAREGAFKDYFETSAGADGKPVRHPPPPVTYEIRYVDGESNETVASMPIAVTSRVITLELPVTVVAGTAFEVTWEAMEASGDSITIVAADAAEGTFASYFETKDGPTGTLVAPIAEGDYEIRFVSGHDSATMAAGSITVTPLEITITAPAAVDRKRRVRGHVDWPKRAG